MASELVQIEIGRDVALTATSWSTKHDLDLEEWKAIGSRLGAITSSAYWWIGDWLNYGLGVWGERRYPEAAQLTGYAVTTLRRMASVANLYEPEERVEGLTFNCHGILAFVEKKERERWLRRVQKGGWSDERLRHELVARHVGPRRERAQQAQQNGQPESTQRAVSRRAVNRSQVPAIERPSFQLVLEELTEVVEDDAVRQDLAQTVVEIAMRGIGQPMRIEEGWKFAACVTCKRIDYMPVDVRAPRCKHPETEFEGHKATQMMPVNVLLVEETRA